MPEIYLPQGNDWHTLDFEHRVCQSFSPEAGFRLEWTDLELKGVDPYSMPQCYLYLADAASHPTGDFLAASVGVIAKPKDIGIKNRWRLKMSPFDLVTDQAYCLEVRGRSMLPPVTYDIRFEKDTGAYARGFMSTSDDAGENWASQVDDDLLFALFGTPPAPPPPPDPPIVNWAILDIEQILTATGYKIIVTTNVPCHLYMNWTTTEPQKHPQTKIERGLVVPAATRYCFVVFHENEQGEAGDTIYHTFIKEPWPSCETRWFCFRAKVDNEWSASISPIFTKHRIAPPWGPPIEDTYLADTDDGYLATWRGSPFMTYAENWNAAAAFLSTVETSNTLYNTDWGNNIYIFRGVLFFNTTTLPENCLIVSAYVRLQTLLTTNTRGALLCLTPATNVHKPLIDTDYHALLDTPTIIASHLMEDLTVPPGMILNLTEEGLAHITKAGITKFGTRIDFEIDADGCPDAHEYIKYWTQEGAPESVRPILVVTYKLPA